MKSWLKNLIRATKRKTKKAYKFSRKYLNPLRIIGLLLVFVVVFIIIGFIYFTSGESVPAAEMEWGVTFSKVFAEQLGLDWQKAYLAILDELGVRKLRLIAYWSEIEKEKGVYDFADLDWQIKEAEKRGAEVILAMGRKMPRWPECHIPEWASDLGEKGQQQRILVFLYEVISHYRYSEAVKIWQVENEPFLRGFGECPDIDEDFLDEELYLVRRFDKRPVMLTTSGELSLWSEPASRTNILGTTLYRIIWHSRLGQFTYPIPPVFYYKRTNLIKKLFYLDKLIVIELQAEPWGPKQIYETSLTRQMWSVDLVEFKRIIEYTKQTGFDEVYLWGAEWWYWLKTVEYEADIWFEAKTLWQE